MKEYKKEFISFLLENKALKFGDFTLKSGRKSPYFLNTGMLYSGSAISRLGEFYAETINDNMKEKFDVVFGPAYKGIPLAVTTVNALYSKFKIDADYSFNRKEAKDHGDKGLLVGRKLEGGEKILLVDDVITAGTAIREVLELLKGLGNPEIAGVVVSVDRKEKGTGEESAIQELNRTTGINFFPVVTIDDIIEYLQMFPLEGNREETDKYIDLMKKYREQYGVN